MSRARVRPCLDHARAGLRAARLDLLSSRYAARSSPLANSGSVEEANTAKWEMSVDGRRGWLHRLKYSRRRGTTERRSPRHRQDQWGAFDHRGRFKVIGDLHSAGNIQVKGTVEGDIISQAVTIGESAHVQGKISAETVRISGSIEDQVEAPSVTVAKTAKMLGDIVYPSLRRSR